MVNIIRKAVSFAFKKHCKQKNAATNFIYCNEDLKKKKTIKLRSNQLCRVAVTMHPYSIIHLPPFFLNPNVGEFYVFPNDLEK